MRHYNLDYIGEVKDIIILRDPFNWLASCVKNGNIKLDMEMWKQHANRCKEGTFHIKFNKWFYDRKYRSNIANRLNIANDHTVVNRLAMPSSFNKTKFINNANDMKVLDRWKFLLENKKYIEYFSEDVVSLSEELFDFNPIVKLKEALI